MNIELKAICSIILLLMGSCSIFKKQQSQKDYVVAKATDVEYQNSVDNTWSEFQPFTVDRIDGFYAVVSFTGPYPFRDVVLGDYPLIARHEIKEAKADVEKYQSHPVVRIELTKEGASKFEKATEENIGKPIAIVIGGQVMSMPVVQGIISGGKIDISGSFSMIEVMRIAKILNTK
ncbi:SecDF P1 head subdomain-containing protein [Sphingobacterium tabacisoli]|uniref:SecDF P1 head subdomain domain-containing protein n=1 Tax=Sphingobacterium tabacisoli TaxID=2044855 RepID=A0ABW5L1Q3_9SPHI|nr:hypothetical protein [Sphingobacterium tabacisoli]